MTRRTFSLAPVAALFVAISQLAGSAGAVSATASAETMPATVQSDSTVKSQPVPVALDEAKAKPEGSVSAKTAKPKTRKAVAKKKSKARRPARVVAKAPAVAPDPEPEPADPVTQPLQAAYDLATTNTCADSYWRKVKVSGYANASYTYNFAKPRSGINSTRLFDRYDDEAVFNLGQLAVMAEATTASRVGFSVKANVGRDARTYEAFNEPVADNASLPEAYVSYRLTDEWLIKAGRMPTLAGFEVLDEKDNFNISRGYMFQYLEPFTHTGLRATYTGTEGREWTFGVNRGYDTFRYDNNDATSYEAQYKKKINDEFNYALTVIGGPEQFENSRQGRFLTNFILNYTPNTKTTLGASVDYVHEGKTAIEGGGEGQNLGVGLYAKRDVTEKLSFAGRLEGMTDSDGRATGEKRNLGNLTLTAQYKLRKNLMSRLELRHDASDRRSFETDGSTARSQNTVAASMIYTF